MSFENKGSMATTAKVSLEPDRSGNYVCSGANDEVDIQRAIDDGWTDIYLGEGTYSISASIVDNGNNNVTIRGAGKYATKLDNQSALITFDLTTCSGWIIKDLEIDGNDFDSNSHHGIRFNGVDDSLVRDVWIHNFAWGYEHDDVYGAKATSCDRTDFVRCKVNNISHAGIILISCNYSNIVECKGEDICYVNGSAHFLIYATAVDDRATYCNIIDCTVNTGDTHGLQIYRWCDHCYIIGGHVNLVEACAVRLGNGAYTDTCTHIGAIGVTIRCASGTSDTKAIEVHNSGTIVEGCNIEFDDVGNPITILDTSQCIINGNHVDKSDAASGGRVILLNDSDYCVVTDNLFIGPASGGIAVEFSNGASYNSVTDNLFYDFGTGISVLATAVENYVESSNRMYDVATECSDAGTDTVFSTLHDSFASFDGGASKSYLGFRVDADGEHAFAWLVAPPDLQRAMKIVVWAVSQVTEVDAMRLEGRVHYGAENESYGAAGAVVADKPSDTTNFAANDVIKWTFPNTEAAISSITPYDNILVRAYHEIAGGGDCETEANFTNVVLHYI